MRIVASQSKRGFETEGFSKGKGSFDSFVKRCLLICLRTQWEVNLYHNWAHTDFKKISCHSVLYHVLMVLSIYKVTKWMAFIVLSNKSEKPSACILKWIWIDLRNLIMKCNSSVNFATSSSTKLNNFKSPRSNGYAARLHIFRAAFKLGRHVFRAPAQKHKIGKTSYQ